LAAKYDNLVAQCQQFDLVGTLGATRQDAEPEQAPNCEVYEGPQQSPRSSPSHRWDGSRDGRSSDKPLVAGAIMFSDTTGSTQLGQAPHVRSGRNADRVGHDRRSLCTSAIRATRHLMLTADARMVRPAQTTRIDVSGQHHQLSAVHPCFKGLGQKRIQRSSDTSPPTPKHALLRYQLPPQ
jgi:hypothetical protein